MPTAPSKDDLPFELDEIKDRDSKEVH